MKKQQLTTLIVATGNPGKLQEMQAHLQGVNVKLKLKPEELDIEETGTTFEENACLKATSIAKALGEWAIADDSGLAVDALGGAPGLYSARYGSSDRDRCDRLLQELGDRENRQARFICVVAIARPDGSIAIVSEGICEGEILYTPRGSGGFGYDPIFYVPQHNKTFAEMSPELKRTISHRGKAFENLLPQFTNLQ
ncbi:RdgB/HAM1 family non-canonical purine NTP pyrophosphatase [Spirulina sp. 06S082]|uniref:RdgB/HAM1 family non-canonical purine NTP pyrophosphatase n=1 Tax=Spirulina sp. 06S082 TaxID=3110248 RepID=UPI002B20C97F|nr:RdgB/HAM1 family non-canonical purine NTP pyrophosphatase [Spirulina sp. 06S082]MEA5467532.1 RdgB/HAM1 family non-canonical purine NTP pyrophosphatase [Spirulina sp. 06S082]